MSLLGSLFSRNTRDIASDKNVFDVLPSGDDIPEFENSSPDSEFEVQFESNGGDLGSKFDPDEELPYSAVIDRAYAPFMEKAFDVFTIEDLEVKFRDIPDEGVRHDLIRKSLDAFQISMKEVSDELIARKAAINTASRLYQDESEAVRKRIAHQISEASAFIEKLSAKEKERVARLGYELENINYELSRIDKMLAILNNED